MIKFQVKTHTAICVHVTLQTICQSFCPGQEHIARNSWWQLQLESRYSHTGISGRSWKARHLHVTSRCYRGSRGSANTIEQMPPAISLDAHLNADTQCKHENLSVSFKLKLTLRILISLSKMPSTISATDYSACPPTPTLALQSSCKGQYISTVVAPHHHTIGRCWMSEFSQLKKAFVPDTLILRTHWKHEICRRHNILCLIK